MLRIILSYLLPFILPFAAFFLYRILMTSGQPLLRRTPWFVLSMIGMALVVGTLVSFALFGGEAQEGVYVPPSFEDGRVVPGHVRPPLVEAPDEAAPADGDASESPSEPQ